MRKRTAIIAGIVLALCVAGLILHEPQFCPLCLAEQSDIPCLMNLHTGEIGEMRIGNGELSDDPATFVFYLVDVVGCEGYCDTGARCCRLELEQSTKTFNRFIFCRSCREKLQECQRYAVLDLRQPEAVVYPAAVGEFTIGKYQIGITSSEESLSLLVSVP